MAEFIFKKGASHVEIIISFGIFSLFVLFILLVLRPFGTTNISGSVVSGIYDNLEKKTSTNLTSAVLYANTTNSPCFNVSLPKEIFIYEISRSIVTNISNEGPIDSSIYKQEKKLDLLIKDNKSKFYNLYFSPDFELTELQDNCDVLDSYVLGGIIERKIISYKSLKDMKTKYFTDYQGLKRELGVPDNLDFSVIVEADIDEDLSMERQYPSTGEIYTREYLAEILYVKDNRPIVKTAKFSIRVW